MKRRAFLLYSMGAALFGLPVTSCRSREPVAALSQPQVLMRLCDAATMQKIGKAYRKLVPAESTKHKLAEQLLENSTDNTLTRETDNTAVMTFLDKKIHQDFAAGRILTLHGWMISVTEARQCALFSLRPA